MQCWARTPGNHIRNSLCSPTAPDHCRWHFPTCTRSFTQPGWVLPSQDFTAGVHTQECPTYHKCARPCSCEQGFPASSPRADTWEHSWGISKHWPHQRQGPCPREVIPHGQWLQNLCLNNLPSCWAGWALIARFGIFKWHQKKQFWWFLLWIPSLKHHKIKWAGPIGSQSLPMLKTYGHC